MMKVILFIVFVNVLFARGQEVFVDKGKFLYFAYGSNLLERRIHINSTSAKLFSPAKLSGYRLDFNIYMSSWNGAVATIVEDPDSDVWGALWIINLCDMQRLDDQEGVNIGRYYAKNVTVTTPDGVEYMARTYPETVDPPKVPSYELPPERQPSDTYMQVIIYGALECRLPIDYVRYLFTFRTNRKLASWDIRQKLGPPFNYTESIDKKQQLTNIFW